MTLKTPIQGAHILSFKVGRSADECLYRFIKDVSFFIERPMGSSKFEVAGFFLIISLLAARGLISDGCQRPRSAGRELVFFSQLPAFNYENTTHALAYKGYILENINCIWGFFLKGFGQREARVHFFALKLKIKINCSKEALFWQRDQLSVI